MATHNIELFTIGLSGLFSRLNYRQTSFFILFIMTQKRPTKANSFFDLKSLVNPYGKVQLEDVKLVSYMSRLFTAPYFFKDHQDRALTSTCGQLLFLVGF